MRKFSKILVLVCLLSFSIESCIPEDNAIYNTPLEVDANDEDQDTDDEPEPNN